MLIVTVRVDSPTRSVYVPFLTSLPVFVVNWFLGDSTFDWNKMWSQNSYNLYSLEASAPKIWITFSNVSGDAYFFEHYLFSLLAYLLFGWYPSMAD